VKKLEVKEEVGKKEKYEGENRGDKIVALVEVILER